MATATGKNIKKRGAREEDKLPSAEEFKVSAEALARIASSTRYSPSFFRLHQLSQKPPKVILLEGGSVTERKAAALYWGLLLNCNQPVQGEEGATPCYSCPLCLKFLARMHRDLFFLDGTTGSITIDEVRQVRASLGEAPREASYRTVILAEAQSLTEAAANAMLKSLEEALPSTVFVLTSPQRERLLPTLVSRSWVLTLAWPDPLQRNGERGEEDEWARIASEFLASGRGLFERSGAKGGVDAAGAHALLLALQRGMALALVAGVRANPSIQGEAPSGLIRFFSALPPQRLAMAHAALAEGQDSLTAQANPALVVEWVLTRLFLLQPKGAR